MRYSELRGTSLKGHYQRSQFTEFFINWTLLFIYQLILLGESRMNIATKKFSTKKSSVSCLLSVLLSATALTAPISLTTSSFGMESSMTSNDITGKMLDILEAETNKNNTSLQLKEIQPTIFNASDNSVQKVPSFNLGHQQNAIYAVMYQLSQTADFNNFQALANILEDDIENNFLVKTTEKIRNDFDFSAQIIINGGENLKTLDIAQRVFLFHSISSYSIYTQAYREAYMSIKNDLARKYSAEKAMCDEELNTLNDTVNMDKNKIENDSNAAAQKITTDIERTKTLLTTTTTQADKITLTKMIQEYEAQSRENNTKKAKDLNIQSKKILDKENENIKKLASMASEHKKITDDYRHKLGFIFEGKGASYIPLKKTAIRYWNNEKSSRTDYSFYQDMDLLIHSNESIMPIARAKFFYTLFKDFKDATPGQIKRNALESLLGFNDDDKKMIQDLFQVNMGVALQKVESVSLHNNNHKIIKVSEPTPVDNSNVITTKEVNVQKISPKVAEITNQVATDVVKDIAPKKKMEEPQPTEVTTTKQALPQKDQKEIISYKAKVIVGSSEQKKNEVYRSTNDNHRSSNDATYRPSTNTYLPTTATTTRYGRDTKSTRRNGS